MGFFDDLTRNLGSLAQSAEEKTQGKGGLLGAAAVGGLLGALLGGSRGVQRTARNAVVIGAGAGAAALAYKLYQKWRADSDAQPQHSAPVPASAPDVMTPPQSVQNDDKALLLIQAMVFAARADGHIDAAEQELILKSAQELSGNINLQETIASFMQMPIDPAAIAQRVSSPEEAADVYFLSALIVNPDTFMEKSYSTGLAQALGLTQAQKAELDERAAQARAQLSTAQLPN